MQALKELLREKHKLNTNLMMHFLKVCRCQMPCACWKSGNTQECQSVEGSAAKMQCTSWCSMLQASSR